MKGLWDKYIISKTSGKPLAPNFYAIVLRIDGGQYVNACRAGALAFAEAVRDENPLLSNDIQHKVIEYQAEDEKFQRLLDKAEKAPKGSFLNP